VSGNCAGQSTSGPLRTEDLDNIRIYLPGVSVWRSHFQVYVYSTIRPSSLIVDNRHGLAGYSECDSLNQCLGMFGRLISIKIYKEQIVAQMYSESVLIKTRNNYRGVDPVMLFIHALERFWRTALQSCGARLIISCCPLLIDSSSKGVVYAS